MSDEPKFDQKFALDRFRQWHFWWLVVFSFLLIITFVYYLPTRFLQQAGTEAPHGQNEEDAHMMDEHMQEHMKQGMTEEEMEKHMEEESAGEKMEEHMKEDGHVEEGTMMNGHEEGGHEAIYHEEAEVKQGLAVNLNVNPVPYKVGVPLSLDFFVNQKPGNIPVLANQLQVEHTKLMHVVGLRSDMNEFFHIHPEFLADNPSIFSIEHTFKEPGLYKIWSSVKKDSIDHTFGHPELNITGDGLREEKKVTFSRNVITGDYQVSLASSDLVVKGREVELTFDIHSLTGQEITVEDFLGAQMHLVLIKDDLKQFMHTHPASHEHSSSGIIPVVYAHGGVEDEPAGVTDKHQTTSDGDEIITFHVAFPEAGLYKAFAQFRPQGINLLLDEAITAEFWLQVEEKAPFPVSQWWGLLVVSAILIAGLSWGVNRYLQVKSEDIKINAK